LESDDPTPHGGKDLFEVPLIYPLLQPGIKGKSAGPGGRRGGRPIL